MAEEASKIPSPFDVRAIKYLVRLMSRHDLSEIDLREGDLRIRLRRGPESHAIAPSQALSSATMPQAAATSTPVVVPSGQEAVKAGKTLLEIKSETPGTFYTSPSPGAEPYVRVGARVTATTVVCMIEAMKIFNDIPAGCTGVIEEICVENQQPVEYGQVLFKVDPAG